MTLSLNIVHDLSLVPPDEWNALAGDHPLAQHGFLATLETTKCVGAGTGWTPEHLVWHENGTTVAALPLYRKSDSYGEFVFDWAWARAYTEAGGAYYPKLVSALPFTPCPGPRLFARDDATRDACIAQTLDYAAHANVSSLHILLCNAQEAAAWGAAGAMTRTGVQFHWQRGAMSSFDDYLAAMTHDKRKRIKQERRKVHEAGVTFRILHGDEITAADWAHFYRCTAMTYAVRQSAPYLSFDFFRAYAQKVPTAQLLIIGERDGEPLCAALNWLGNDTLYGRYWGALEFVPGLHFETCYYQAIEWCLQKGVSRFEGGAQGEHKLARGFLPVETHSAHWIAHPQFADAVARFLQRERVGVQHAIDELEASSPYKS